ncbi:MAG: epoxyqueuosine reductase QueH [Alphaproteobacteria bacterium]|nr:epoxyqueuosine reductase QueH [Alphaproteobacteria bacterium]
MLNLNNNNSDKMLLLSCCAPCACAVIERLKQQGQAFSVLFYNPNIHPLKEYEKRRDEQRRLCQKWDIEFIELEYDCQRWFACVKGYEQEPERGKRCDICFELRLERAMVYAKQQGYRGVASVLGVSRWKDLAQVNRAAQRASAKTGVAYIELEGRKGGMQQRRQDLIRELELYRQDYCGCIYSKSAL